jgi:2-iminobutanoate/2-iminopropanoate deaminase
MPFMPLTGRENRLSFRFMVGKIIESKSAPAPIGPYAQAVRAGDFLFVSGQLPIDPASGQLVAGDAGAATERAIANLAAVLEAAGASLDCVVKTTVYLQSLDDFPAMNEAYARSFGGSKPARACVECSRLPKGAPVEIDAVAYLGK